MHERIMKCAIIPKGEEIKLGPFQEKVKTIIFFSILKDRNSIRICRVFLPSVETDPGLVVREKL